MNQTKPLFPFIQVSRAPKALGSKFNDRISVSFTIQQNDYNYGMQETSFVKQTTPIEADLDGDFRSGLCHNAIFGGGVCVYQPHNLC